MIIKKSFVFGILFTACTPTGSDRQGTTPGALPGDESAPSQHPEGTITSSGGYLYGYETNPWFLQNTEEVKYCIDMDDANFGVTKEKARSAITFAIDTWKSQLQKIEYDRAGEEDLRPWQELRLGTQIFKEASCDDQNVSLRFQLGTLSSTQRAQVGNPRRYIARAIETSYDEVNMRGAGFIYLAPENGELRPDEPEAAEHFWSRADGFVLKYVLMHELGHVFGFGHNERTLMGEDGPQKFISKRMVEGWESIGSSNEFILNLFLSDLFGYRDDAMGVIQGSRSSNEDLFGENAVLDHAIQCEHNANVYISCSMYEITRTEQGERIRGKKIGHIDGKTFESGSMTIASVKIPRAQTVLTISDNLRSALGYPTLKIGTANAKKFSMSGTYVSADGSVKMPMRVSSITDDPSGLQVEVVDKGDFRVIAH